MMRNQKKYAHCSSYCDGETGTYIPGSTCISNNNHTIYCCGTPSHKYCCYDKDMDIGDMPGVMSCDTDIKLRMTNLLPWIPVLIVLMAAYPILRKCHMRGRRDNQQTNSQQDAEAGNGEDDDAQSIPSPGLPPSYDDVTAKPPSYEQVCGLVNFGFNMGDVDEGADALRVHNSAVSRPASSSPSGQKQTNTSAAAPPRSGDQLINSILTNNLPTTSIPDSNTSQANSSSINSCSCGLAQSGADQNDATNNDRSRCSGACRVLASGAAAHQAPSTSNTPGPSGSSLSSPSTSRSANSTSAASGHVSVVRIDGDANDVFEPHTVTIGVPPPAYSEIPCARI